MNTIQQTKKELRAKIHASQSSLSDSERQTENKSIIQQIEESSAFKKSEWVMAYWPMPNEVDLRELIHCNGDKNWLLPSIEDGALVLKRYEGDSSLFVSKHFGILEPKGKALDVFEEVGLILVPGVAFDSNGGRLGHGKGYYDNLLPKLKNAYKVGVGFSYQLVARVPCEAHDYPLDEVVIGQ